MGNLSKKGVFVIAGCMMMAILIQCLVCSIVSAQLNENCTISVLNRTVTVDSNGNWQLNNVPTNMGPVRVRVTCTEDGKTVSGQSELVTIPTNGNIPVEEIFFHNDYEQVPIALTINSEKSVLSSAGETTRLTVWATYPDGSSLDVTSSGQGTAYTVSNPSIGTVSSNGVVTAITSGNVIVSVSNEMVLSSISLSVQLSGDSDGDGLPDDFELANGLNPNNPIDALEDMDTDGLTNIDEFTRGTDMNNADTDSDGIEDGEEVVAGEDGFITNPLLGDSDGDGIWDGLEVSSGTDPNDANSFDLASTLDFMEVTPSNFVIVFNTIMGEATRQLTVTGTLTDGRTIDLTSSSLGTNYTSSDWTVANFGITGGLVYAGIDGAATITATNSGFSAEAVATIQTFAPQAVSVVPLGVSANNVDIANGYAYVATYGGLFVVDVSNPLIPSVVTSLDTPGNSHDIKISGNRAFIADGSSGLRIIDISAPSVPLELGFVDTPGIAQDLVIRDNLAFVADGSFGLQVIDITDPANPMIIGSVDTPGIAKGVDVDSLRNLAFIADGLKGLQVVDISVPINPQIVGSLDTAYDSVDLVLHDTIVYLADYAQGGLKAIDISDATVPAVVGTETTGGFLFDVAVSGSLVFGADTFRDNAVLIYSIVNPDTPVYSDLLDFSPLFGPNDGNGIAVDNRYVYLAASGNSLYIGQYRSIQDLGTVPPAVIISSPLGGDEIVEGSTVQISADATDDVFVSSVSFVIDGEVVFTDVSAPFTFNYSVPMGITNFVVGATAIDLAGNIGNAVDAAVNVIQDPLTTVTGTVVDLDGNPLEGALVSFDNLSTNSLSDGTFSIADVPTVQGEIQVTVSVNINGTVFGGTSNVVPPVVGGTTDVSDVIVDLTFLITEDMAIASDNQALDFMDVMVDGATLTVDGTHTFNRLTLTNSATLAHSDTTTTDEYRLDVTVATTLTIDNGSGIDVSGKGYLGANSGGNSGTYGRTIGNTTTGGSVAYSAGSYGGFGGQYGGHSINGVYGSLYNPNELGSGGGGDNGFSGGNGGGLVRITATDIVLNGHIRANGGDGHNGQYNGGGSGGGVYVETGSLSGGGMITANGGKIIGTYGYTTGGGGGRIAIYYDDISGFDTANVTAYGGKGSFNGGAGTIYTKSSTQTYGGLIVNNNNTVTAVFSTPLISVGTGTSTGLTADTLTDGTRNWRTDDLVGIYLNPNRGQGSVMKVLSNDTTTITTDLNDGDMVTVAATGDPYRGLRIFDTLDISGLARVQTEDDIKVLVPNTANGLEIDGVLDVNDIEVVNFPIVVNNGAITVNGKVINASDYSMDNATFIVDSITSNTLTLTNNSLLTHPSTTTTDEYSLAINTTTLTVDASSGIDVSAKGYLGANSGGNSGTYGRTIGNTTTGGSVAYSAGSYGGFGGQYGGHSINGVYGSLYNPNELGSGGGGDNGFSGGNGGGLVRITATDIVLNGHIRANGGDGHNGQYNGGGSGGGVYVETGTLSGGGVITANGGKTVDAHNYTTGGGGGRIAIYYDDISGFNTTNVTAYGGKSSFNGGAGTIYTKSSTQTYGDLIVNNNNTVTAVFSTPLISVGTGTSTGLTADTLTDGTRSWRTDDLVGIYLNPNRGQGSVMRVLNNGATTITTDLNEGDMTTVATTGDPYRGLYIFDKLYIEGLARVQSEDDIKVLAPNSVNGLEIEGDLDVNDIEVDNFPVFVNNGKMTVSGKVTNASDYNLYNSTLVVDSVTSNTLTMTNSSLLTHPATTTTDEYSLVVNTTTLTVDASSGIDVSAKGYLGANSGGNSGTYGRTIGNTTTGGSVAYSAGSYGGFGGQYGGHSINGVYGSLYNPNELGSGGGGDNGFSGGNGGGLVRITATDIVLNGHIRANGGDGHNGQYNGGGSGGGVYVETGSLSGGGVITANGGKTVDAHSYTTGGGGGRIAIYYDDISGFNTTNVTTYGGKSSFNGGAGTIYTKSSTQTYGDLIVNNNNTVTAVFSTPLVSVGTGTSTGLTADTLTDGTRSWRTGDLVGIWLNPNINQGTTPNVVFQILSNDSTSITGDNTLNNLTDVASTGDSYIGEHYIDYLSVINGARVETSDRIIFNNLTITGGELQADGFYQIGKSETSTKEKLAKHQGDSMQRENDTRKKRQGAAVRVQGVKKERGQNREERKPPTWSDSSNGECNSTSGKDEVEIIIKEFDTQKVKFSLVKQQHEEKTKISELQGDKTVGRNGVGDTARLNGVEGEVGG